MNPPDLDIRPLVPERLEDFLAYFDGPAFADNPKWRFCYCQYPLVDHTVVRWNERTADENRAAACARIAGGRMQGWLAYRGGEVVGWCHAAPRSAMDAFAAAADPDGERIGRIACFVIARPHRRTGVATRLLAATLDGFRAQGLAFAEATPRRAAESDAEHYTGPLGLYLAAGFTVHGEEPGGSLVVRLSLSPSAR